MEDPEIKAMESIYAAIKELDAEAQARVLAWAANRVGVKGIQEVRRQNGSGGATADGEAELDREFADFVDLFDAVRPATDAMRALVGAYWVQAELSRPSFNAQEV